MNRSRRRDLGAGRAPHARPSGKRAAARVASRIPASAVMRQVVEHSALRLGMDRRGGVRRLPSLGYLIHQFATRTAMSSRPL